MVRTMEVYTHPTNRGAYLDSVVVCPCFSGSVVALRRAAVIYTAYKY